MLFVAETQFIALLLGLLIGLVVSYWIFKGRRAAAPPADTISQAHAQETPLP
ncbi:hypothetical protein [Sphingomonas parva]|uniref:hypothetical protein n=1 Tax=Sphingomonas parva TaxID=2555898 RepID=UPI0014320FF7|nr:hypothetical protein [Sphingomonas parva]